MSLQLDTRVRGATTTRPRPVAPRVSWWARVATFTSGDRRLLLVLSGLTFLLRFPAFVVPVFNSDETFLGTQAQVINAGGALYSDAIDRKPPLVPYLYAWAFRFFGTTALWSVRVLAMVAVVVTAYLVAREARRRYGPRAAALAGVLFVVAMVAFAPQDGQAANFEVFMLPTATASILFARRGRAMGSGVMVAFATLAKQTGAATLLPVAYLLLRRRGRKSLGHLLLGFAFPIGAVAVAVGPGKLLYWAVLGNGSYLSAHAASLVVVAMFFVMTAGWAVCNAPLLAQLPRAWSDRLRRGNDGDHDIDLWLWLASGAVSVAIGLRFFGHYYIQLVPPLVLLATGALVRGSARTLRRTVAVVLCFGVVFSAAGYVVHPFGNEPQYESVSRYLADHAGAKDRILVWGSVPEIYWASNKLPATRFLSSGTFLTGNHPGRPADDVTTGDDTSQAWDYFFEDFTEHPPEYVLDTSAAEMRGAQFYPIANFPILQAILDGAYEQVQGSPIDGIRVFKRK